MSTLQNHLPKVIFIALLLGLLVSVSFRTYLFVDSEYLKPQATDLSGSASSANLSATRSAPKPKVDPASFDLFGKAAPQKQGKKIDTSNLPKTNLRLVLRGISADLDGKSGSALIEGPDRQTDNYKVGDSLPGNAKLTRVFPERVVINRSGKLENLYFPEQTNDDLMQAVREADLPPDDPPEDLPEEVQQAVQARADQESDEAASAPVSQPVSGGGSVMGQLSDERKAEIKRRLESLRERMSQRQQP